MIAEAAVAVAIAVTQQVDGPTKSEVLFPNSGLPAARVARIASRNAKPYWTLLASMDPAGDGFRSSTPKQVVQAVRARLGAAPRGYMLIDIDPAVTSDKGRKNGGPWTGDRMAELVRALKAAYPGTKWAWRGIPTCPAPGSASWNDLQFKSLADLIDWTCPANVAGTSGGAPAAVTGANAVSAARAWARARPVIVQVSQWLTTDANARSPLVRARLMPIRELLEGQIAAARTAGSDGVMFTNPSLMSATQVVQTAGVLESAIISIRAQQSLALGPSATAPLAARPSSLQSDPRAPSKQVPLRSAETVRSAETALSAIPKRLLQPYSGPLALKATNWGSLYARSFDSAALSPMMAQLSRMAEVAYGQPSNRYIRPMTFDSIPKDMLYAPTLRIQPQERRDLNQLAGVDTIQTSFLRTQGVALAIVANRTRNQDYIQRCIEMLEAVNQYRPLQRPGNTYGDESVPMTADGDGVWLATAWGIDAIVEMLNALGTNVPAELRVRLEAQLRDEVGRIAKDWAERRPWFVRSRKAQSNQWIEPSVALVKACLFLRDRDLLSAYELGAENLAATLAALGADGSFNEGLGYADMSVGRLLEAVRLMRDSGDARLSEEPFVKRSWHWFVQMYMPGGMLVNSFDGAKAWLPEGGTTMPMASLGSAALASGEPNAISTLRYLFPQLKGNYSLEAIQLIAALEGRSEPARLAIDPFAFFPAQQLLVWRSAFEPLPQAPTAWSLWIRGGSESNNHCHRDQGHISVCNRGRPVLIEAGWSDYGTTEYDQYFSAAAGHGVMQVGALQPNGQPVKAPIYVAALGASGGAVTVDCTAAFPAASNYVRKVQWESSGTVGISDDLTLREPVQAGAELFRFHTGSELSLGISGGETRWTVTWAGASMTLSSSLPIQVEQASLADSVTRGGRHQAIVIRAAGELRAVRLNAALTLEVGPGR